MAAKNVGGRLAIRMASRNLLASKAHSGGATFKWKQTAALETGGGASAPSGGGRCSPHTARRGLQYSEH